MPSRIAISGVTGHALAVRECRHPENLPARHQTLTRTRPETPEAGRMKRMAPLETPQPDVKP